MTITAQGTRMRCDATGCTQTATVEKDAWAFCAAHAGTRPGAVAARPAPPRDVVRRDLGSGATQTMSAPTGPGPIGLLLEQASAHSNKRVRNLGEKIEADLDQLRVRITDLAEDEKRKQAEAAAKAKARAEITRLEQQLAAAKAALRGKPTARAHTGPAVDRQLPCSNGCGRTSPNIQGLRAHERHCTHGATT